MPQDADPSPENMLYYAADETYIDNMIPTTSTTLLRQIGEDAQHKRWNEFVARYRPMMESFLRERFPTVDADDIVQETLVALCRVLPSYRYAPDEKGHFRSYLTGILRNKALRVLRKERRQGEIVDDLRQSPSADSADEDQAYREAIFEIALRQFLADESVADRTKRIFERTAINGESPEDVAVAFKMTRHAVDQAKSRAMSRLRQMVKEMETAANA